MEHEPIFCDTETIGLHGPIVLVQYAIGDGEIVLYEPWKHTVDENILFFENLVNHEGGIIGFNLVFDWFHICQMLTTLYEMKGTRIFDSRILEKHIDDYALAEPNARLGPCCKPKHAFDIMLHARKGKYQSTMSRRDIRIRRVPTALAWMLADELVKRIPLKDIYFAKRKDKTVRWQVFDLHDDIGDMIPDFKDLVLKFAPSSALKALAEDALGVRATRFGEIEPPKRSMPEEYGYAPFALAIGNPDNWQGAWPDYGKIRIHIDHWAYNQNARQYAEDDVTYTRSLYKYFDSPEMDDDDSILACMVGAIRWRGFAIDLSKVIEVRKETENRLLEIGREFGYTDARVPTPKIVKTYLEQVMKGEEKSVFQVNEKITTGAIVLEEIAGWTKEKVCDCKGRDIDCKSCGGDGLVATDEPHPAASRARLVLEARRAKKEIELLDKFIIAGRFHASLDIIGTKSTRMSGSGGDLNAQGINRDKKIRRLFTLADGGMRLLGGDFESFEVSLMDAIFQDPKLREELQEMRECVACGGIGKIQESPNPDHWGECPECKGEGKVKTKIHGLMGTKFFPDMTYDEIMATKGLKGELDKYGRSKNGVFCLAYFGDEHSLATRVGIPESVGLEAFQGWVEDHPVWGKRRREIQDKYCSMKQPDGIGTQVIWAEPAEYSESIFGFRRYFTLENRICRELYNLAQDPPKAWKKMKVKVQRRDREQTVSGATQSALYAAAFNLQGQCMRAAGNNEIQSPGASLTKKLQVKIWDFQDSGIGEWAVMPLNVHDEVMCPANPTLTTLIRESVEEFVEEYKKVVPLLEIDWSDDLTSWAEK